MKKINSAILFLTVLIIVSCSGKADSEYEKQIDETRKQKNEYMKNDPNSPFNSDTRAEYHPLKYFEPDTSFIFRSKLTELDKKDTIKIFGTKGEEREAIRYGYLLLETKDDVHRLNVYKNKSQNGTDYYSVWFTDETTNEETYGVGRYLDFEKSEDSNYVYTIDFNLAFNPYCAYSAMFSCAIPSKEDHLEFAVLAGEKKFHE